MGIDRLLLAAVVLLAGLADGQIQPTETRPARTLSGRVLDSFGRPVSEFRVAAFNSNRTGFVAIDGERILDASAIYADGKDGVFELDSSSLGENARVVVNASIGGPAMTSPVANGSSNLEIALPTGLLIEGVVRDP